MDKAFANFSSFDIGVGGLHEVEGEQYHWAAIELAF